MSHSKPKKIEKPAKKSVDPGHDPQHYILSQNIIIDIDFELLLFLTFSGVSFIESVIKWEQRIDFKDFKAIFCSHFITDSIKETSENVKNKSSSKSMSIMIFWDKIPVLYRIKKKTFRSILCKWTRKFQKRRNVVAYAESFGNYS